MTDEDLRINENRREVYKAHREAQNRYTYFLLAAAGAAIALFVNDTRELALTLSQIPLGIGVAGWGLSFLFGCRHLANINDALAVNETILHIKGDLDPETKGSPEAKSKKCNELREDFNTYMDRADRNSYLQFCFLIGGAIAYLVWHVYGMYLRTGSR